MLIMISENISSKPGFEALNALRDTHGEKLAGPLIERIADDPEIRRVIVYGEPGVGKTTLLSQIKMATDRVGYTVLLFDDMLELYGEMLTAQMHRLGRIGSTEVFDRTHWEIPEWTEFAEFWFKQLNEPLKLGGQSLKGFSQQGNREDSKILAETLSQGNPAKGAVATLFKLAKQSMLQAEPETLFIGTPVFPHIQEKALRVRERMRKAQTLEEKLAILDLENICLDLNDEENLTRVFKKMGRPESIGRIRLENLSMQEAWAQQLPRREYKMFEDAKSKRLVVRGEEIILPESTSALRPVVQKTYKLAVGHMLYQMRYILRIPEEYGVVALTDYLEDQPINWYQKVLQTAA